MSCALVSSVYLCLFRWEGFPRQTCIIRDVNSWNKFRLYNNSSGPALGGACAMGRNTMAWIQTRQIQAIMTVPQRLSFSAQLSNSNVATCWHVELSMFSLLDLSFKIHSSNRFSCCIKFFYLIIPWANLGAVLAQKHKNTDV